MKLLWAAILIFCASQTQAKPQHPTVVYGDDDRAEVYEYKNTAYATMADVVMSMVFKADLMSSGKYMTFTKPETAQSFYGLCDSEPYKDQISGAYCTAFLIDSDLVATAGHCVEDVDCSEMLFIFGFDYSTAKKDPALIDPKEVYGCSKIEKQEMTRKGIAGTDYAVVRLDRKVKGHKPLKLSTQGPPLPNDKLVVIGNGMGLPTKIAPNGYVRSIVSKSFFSASLDTYKGNSGSPVFNEKTGLVEGILVDGEEDFVQTKDQCYISNVCKEDGCSGELVTLISEIFDPLKN